MRRLLGETRRVLAGSTNVTFSGTHSNVTVPQMGGDAAALMSGSVLRTISCTADAASQLTSASPTGELREFLWDYRNRLIQVTDKDNEGNIIQVIKYVYDVFDLRIGRLRDTTNPFDFADAAIERYVLDGGDVVLDFVDPDGNGSAPIALSKRYLHGEAVDQIFAQEDVTLSLSDPNRTLWFLTDDLGTVRDLMRGDGTIAAHYKFEAFGKPTSGDTSKTRFLFTSREFDPATGLQYNRARWYDPATGRWISEDPIGFAAGDANLSRYVTNFSTSSRDPSGLQEDRATRMLDLWDEMIEAREVGDNVGWFNAYREWYWLFMNSNPHLSYPDPTPVTIFVPEKYLFTR
jgi:RHS repeat-associated protein